MEGTKSIFTSVTFWGVVISILSKVAALAGYEVPVEGLDILMAGFVGDLISIWGRVVATKKIGKTEVVIPEAK